jgi:hypothetical protein
MSHNYFEIDASVTTIPQNTWLEIMPSTVFSVFNVQFFYYSPSPTDYGLIKLAVGEPGDEEVIICSSQKQAIPFPLYIDQDSRLSIQSIGQDLTTGRVVLCFLS